MWIPLRRRPAVRTASALRYRAAPQVVSARHGDRVVLMDPRRGRYFGLDEVGGEIWRLLGEARDPAGRTLAELVDGLESEYEAEREQLERDAVEFLGRLESARLVVTA